MRTEALKLSGRYSATDYAVRGGYISLPDDVDGTKLSQVTLFDRDYDFVTLLVESSTRGSVKLKAGPLLDLTCPAVVAAYEQYGNRARTWGPVPDTRTRAQEPPTTQPNP